MARTSTGAYALPEAPFVAGTTAKAARVNNNFSDIGTELQDSLSRSGKGGMLADLALGGHKASGAAAGSAVDDLIRWDQAASIRTGTYTASGGVIACPVVGGEPWAIEFTALLPSTLVALFFRISVDNGVSFLFGATEYVYTNLTETAGTTVTPGSGAISYAPIGVAQQAPAYGGVSGEIVFYPAIRNYLARTGGVYGSSPAAGQELTNGYWTNAGTVTHVLIGAVGSSLSTGTARVIRRHF